MGGGSKTLLAGLVVLLLAVGLVACGGDDDDPSATTTEVSEPAQSGGEQAGGGESPQPEAKDGAGEPKQTAPSDGGDGSGSFKPKQHKDSGGGSDQFRVNGGDNSVQEFGEEADVSERDQAAAALHNFFDARAQGEWEAACSYLARSLSKSLEELAVQAKLRDTSCARGLKAQTNPEAKDLLLAEAAQIDVGSLRIEDDFAFVIYSGPDGIPFAMPVMLEGDTWKVAALAGGPLA